MQIQPSSAAGAAAGSVSQATSKDRAGGSAAAEGAAVANPTGVERVARGEETSADRDAQGGGAGLDRRPSQPATNTPPVKDAFDNLPVRPPEPPSQLDLLG